MSFVSLSLSLSLSFEVDELTFLSSFFLFIGQGWLEVLYVDEDIRVSKGSKGSLFVHTRSNLLWSFWRTEKEKNFFHCNTILIPKLSVVQGCTSYRLGCAQLFVRPLQKTKINLGLVSQTETERVCVWRREEEKKKVDAYKHWVARNFLATLHRRW